MIRANVIGPKVFYLNPGNTTFDSTIIAAVDSTCTPDAANVKPYAYSATVRDDYDARNFFVSKGSPATLISGQRLAFGLFLTPELSKGNLLFQLSGRLALQFDINYLNAHFFFGRKGTDNTVVSDTASANNALDKYMILPASNECATVDDSSDDIYTVLNIQTELVTLAESAGHVYCFGVMVDNLAGSNRTFGMDCSLSIRKYGSEFSAFTPVR